MKVREEPTTPWTIEMLPASRFESWARNSVGRSPSISRAFEPATGFASTAASTAGSRSPPPAQTIMWVCASKVASPFRHAWSSARPAAWTPMRCHASIWR